MNQPHQTTPPLHSSQVDQPETVGTLPTVIAALSFIPLLGVFFGVIAILWGLITRKAKRLRLILLGVGGILFTVLIYGSLFYFGFVQRGGIYDQLRGDLAKQNLTELVRVIEMYKLQHGSYPRSLRSINQSRSRSTEPSVMITDVSSMRLGNTPREYYYELIDRDHYYLLGLGEDGRPFTADDLLPKLKTTAHSKVGLVIKRSGQP